MDKLRAAAVTAALKEIYPDAVCALEYGGDPWRLLVMSRLSAQCTDRRVNEVSAELFRRYPDAGSLAGADVRDVEEIVRPCGLHRTKARDIVAESRKLVSEYGGVLPGTMDELLSFPGVGRKIANLLLGDVFGQPAIVADTHCIRLSGRIGLVPKGTTDPAAVERILKGLIEPAEQNAFCHRLVMFGRDVCTARKPSCASCPLAGLCANPEENTP